MNIWNIKYVPCFHDLRIAKGILEKSVFRKFLTRQESHIKIGFICE
jgi:hypothetical protein